MRLRFYDFFFKKKLSISNSKHHLNQLKNADWLLHRLNNYYYYYYYRIIIIIINNTAVLFLFIYYDYDCYYQITIIISFLLLNDNYFYYFIYYNYYHNFMFLVINKISPLVQDPFWSKPNRFTIDVGFDSTRNQLYLLQIKRKQIRIFFELIQSVNHSYLHYISRWTCYSLW